MSIAAETGWGTEPDMWHLRTFGGLALETDSGAAAVVPRRRPVALLAILAIAGARGLGREKISALLWPESDEEHVRDDPPSRAGD